MACQHPNRDCRVLEGQQDARRTQTRDPSRPRKVGPHDLFLAAYDDSFQPVSASEETSGTKLFNKRVVQKARQYVWGVDASQLHFVRKHMATWRDCTLLTEAEWQEMNAIARGCLAEATALASTVSENGTP